MAYRIDPGGRVPRSTRSGRGWVSSLLSVGVVGALAGVWACVPGTAVQPLAPAAAVSKGFVAPAMARPLAPPPQAQPLRLAEELDRDLGESLRAPAAPAFRIAARHDMTSTMYCLKGKTRTGIHTRDGVAAADPEFLPLGSVVRLSHPDGRPLGVFVIMDTGGAVKGPKVDIYVDDCREARRWGIKKVVAEVLDLGREAD
ncbi:MAG TPA: 3D domain-containing protein [Longimicrobiaceae bacterium]|nr:3D domain-containing protein [Longimicrobiaceae bacterium]